MKIAVLTSYLYHKVEELDGEDRVIMGGAERYMIELCQFLQKEGHEVQVFQPFRPEYIDPHGQKRPTPALQKNFYGTSVLLIPTADQWEFSTAPGLNYAFNEMTASFDLRIYFVTFMAWPEVRRPAISISHGIFWDFPNHMVRQSSPEQRNEFFRRQLYGFTAPDACVTVDTNVRGVVAAISPGEENRIHVIPNFVDTDKFKPIGLRNWERPRVLYPRRLSTVRGVNDFLWLAAQFPDVDFLCCGNGLDSGMENELSAFTQGQPNIKAVWRKPEDMHEIYQQCDIAIIPTRAAEGTSLSCLEAMATGLPVIATPAGGLPNLIIDGWNGLVVDLNHENLAPALKKLLKSPKLAARFGRRNRQMAVESFDIKIWHRKWKEVIKKVVR